MNPHCSSTTSKKPDLELGIRPRSNWLLQFALVVTLLPMTSSHANPSPSADEKLEVFFKQYLEQDFRLHPLTATRLGDHRFDRLLDDVSAPARARGVEHLRVTLETLPMQVDHAALSRDAQVDFEIFRDSLKRDLWLAENTHPFEEDPRLYSEYISDSVFLVLAQSTLPLEANVANAIARMTQIPRLIEAVKANFTHPPRSVLETAIRQNQGAIGFYEKDLLEFAGKTSRLGEVKAAGERVAACLKEYQKFLETDLMGRATGNWRLGKERFARKLEQTLNAGVTADQVLADAEAEFDRVQRDLYVLARQTWSRYFPKRPLPPDDADGKRATVREVLACIGKDHGRAEDLVRDARQTVAQIKCVIRDLGILELPEPDRCQIIEMPEFQRGNSVAYMNSPPPLDPKATGFYAISPPPRNWDAQRVESLLREYNRHTLQILTIHEAYPGHYVQFEYANRQPSLIRRVLGSDVYIEGWAVYTEQMMLDQGYGEGDLALRLSQLKFYLRAVANAILDHRMHCTEMTDEDALKLLVDGAYQSEGEARLKIIRAKQTSVQLSTYFVGRMAHCRLRQQIQRELGEAFDLGRYHQAVLALGPVPVKYLPELVRTQLGRPH